jgi:hypothetical protein
MGLMKIYMGLSSATCTRSFVQCSVADLHGCLVTICSSRVYLGVHDFACAPRLVMCPYGAIDHHMSNDQSFRRSRSGTGTGPRSKGKYANTVL